MINMPKTQPCPDCKKWGKISQKVAGGGYYHCTKCKSYFFVKEVYLAQLTMERLAK